jgi:hypothetical protein
MSDVRASMHVLDFTREEYITCAYSIVFFLHNQIVQAFGWIKLSKRNKFDNKKKRCRKLNLSVPACPYSIILFFFLNEQKKLLC